MVDIDAAVGFVVARGDGVDRARLSFLRSSVAAGEDVLAGAEGGQTASGGWPAQSGGDVASIDATCFRLAELDDLGGLSRPSAARALAWLASRQHLDGFWEESPRLAEVAPQWARPGDPEARFYLTANAAFWLCVAGFDAARTGGADDRAGTGAGPAFDAGRGAGPYSQVLSRAARAILDSLEDNGTWPGFLVSGWLAAAVLHRCEWFYEAAQISLRLAERVPTMSAADAAWMIAALRRVGVGADDALMVGARDRLRQTQRSDGSWPSDDTPALDVHTTLTALRALR